MNKYSYTTKKKKKKNTLAKRVDILKIWGTAMFISVLQGHIMIYIKTTL